MGKEENQNNKENELYINVGDEIKITDDVTVEVSDITMTARIKDNEQLKFVFPRAVSSEVIAQYLNDALCIPLESTSFFKDFIIENIEHVKKDVYYYSHHSSCY